MKVQLSAIETRRFSIVNTHKVYNNAWYNMCDTFIIAYFYILKAKSNFTLWTTEYIFTVFDLTKLNIAMNCWYPP